MWERSGNENTKIKRLLTLHIVMKHLSAHFKINCITDNLCAHLFQSEEIHCFWQHYWSLIQVIQNDFITFSSFSCQWRLIVLKSFHCNPTPCMIEIQIVIVPRARNNATFRQICFYVVPNLAYTHCWGRVISDLHAVTNVPIGIDIQTKTVIPDLQHLVNMHMSPISCLHNIISFQYQPSLFE